MNKTKKRIFTINEVESVAQELKAFMGECAVFTFRGPLGAGKTTLVRSLLRSCGVTEPITSPTFNYVNIYENDQGQRFYHFDLYRIETLDEFIQAGFDEFLYNPNSWVFIEWPDPAKPLLTKNVCHVSVDYHNSDRALEYTTIEKS